MGGLIPFYKINEADLFASQSEGKEVVSSFILINKRYSEVT